MSKEEIDQMLGAIKPDASDEMYREITGLLECGYGCCDIKGCSDCHQCSCFLPHSTLCVTGEGRQSRPFCKGFAFGVDCNKWGADMGVKDGESNMENKRIKILNEAINQVNGRRENDYGKVEDNFARIADYWSDYKHITFTPLDVAMMMCLLKIARIQNGGGSGDSFVDLAGYAACAGEIAGKGERCRQKES